MFDDISGEALRQLEAFLEPRIQEAKEGRTVKQSVRSIFEETLEEMRQSNLQGYRVD